MPSREPCAMVPLPQDDDAPAAFSSVADQPALVRVVRSLLGPVAGPRIVVATTPAQAARVRDCLDAAGLGAVAVAVTGESGSRRHAIRAGLEHLGVERLSHAPVLIANHRHPLSTSAVANSVIAGLRAGHDVVVPALPVTDTVKTVDHLGSVLGTVDRAALRTVQYPRGFAAAALWKTLSDNVDGLADDEFGIALRAGFTIVTVDGDPNAFQVVLPRDAHLLAAIIACRPD